MSTSFNWSTLKKYSYNYVQIFSWVATLSSVEAFVCRRQDGGEEKKNVGRGGGKWREEEREEKRPFRSSHRPPCSYNFCIILFFVEITCESLWGDKSSCYEIYLRAIQDSLRDVGFGLWSSLVSTTAIKLMKITAKFRFLIIYSTFGLFQASY